MKFRNKKTGEVYDVAEYGDCVASGFCHGIKCRDCGIWKNDPNEMCSKFAMEHPQEAADLMGYEWIKEDNMKPRICEILGVEVNEEFRFLPNRMINRINEDGVRQIRRSAHDTWGAAASERQLIEMIEHPEEIVKVRKWTDEEKDMAKILKKAGVYSVHRDKNTAVSWKYRSDIPGKDFLPNRTFPSLRENETATMDEIIGESNGEE